MIYTLYLVYSRGCWLLLKLDLKLYEVLFTCLIKTHLWKICKIDVCISLFRWSRDNCSLTASDNLTECRSDPPPLQLAKNIRVAINSNWLADQYLSADWLPSNAQHHSCTVVSPRPWLLLSSHWIASKHAFSTLVPDWCILRSVKLCSKISWLYTRLLMLNCQKSTVDSIPGK